MDNSLKSITNNEYDYSNIIPTVEAISYLVKYCDQMNEKLNNLVEEDSEKNKKFKPEYKEHKYKKSYGQKFEVYIRKKTYNNVTCNDYESFKSAVNDGVLKDINGLDIILCMDFYRGLGNDADEHENSFSIIFKPYDIKFARKSNYADPTMDQIETDILSILDSLPVANSVFCDKSLGEK